MSQLNNAQENFDENTANRLMDLYSRQIGAFGVETMKNLTTLDVLIIGLQGVGIELAKNLTLAGPRSVTIVDNEKIKIQDLGTNFFFSEASIGKNRAEVALDPLSKLNPYVNVSLYSGEVTPDFVRKFGAMVVTNNTPLRYLIEWNKVCREHKPPIPFYIALTNGVTATFFTDYGPTHTVTDPNGEPVRVNVVEHIEEVTEGDKSYLVFTVAADEHKLDEDSSIKIDEIHGAEGFTNIPYPVFRVYKQVKNNSSKQTRDVLVPNKFKIEKKPEFKLVGSSQSGTVSEFKKPQNLTFRSLEESIVYPKYEYFLLHPENEKMFLGRGDQLHIARVALWRFMEKTGHLPRLHNEDDANECIKLAVEFNEENEKKNPTIEDNANPPPIDTIAITVKSLSEEAVTKMSLYAATELTGLCAFVGGVISQEVVKKFGKFTPLRQWMHIDYFELLKDKVPDDAKPLNSRYDNQISVFGKAFQDKIGKQKWFMVGCGALGCEYLKGFALMGLGANGGAIHVTDMDRIEISNLNRQFLFHKENVGQPKSVCASKAAKTMNPQMNIITYETPVGPSSENVFDDDFWASLDGVCNALDNIEARQYTDSKIVFHTKYLLESGTLGTKANCEIIIPYQTKSYREYKDPKEEDTIPMCTLRNFPNLIEHCIEWSRAQFTEIFEDPPKDLNSLLKDKNALFRTIEKEGNGQAKLAKYFHIKTLYESCL
eukprot:TRINITY_DN3632_c0_g1_i4.p1 TRINITY_DN3632_c0_g1~~TRINITY_DN3632_c0_g1_i4.p1  ORF type:complete len:712 (-),score=135.54 TRINITY_DN3632_c0_g1_i4:342-2477(-)